jgi:hypothetical protein
MKNRKAQTFPFALLSALFIALHLFLSFNPAVERGWGANYIRFFSSPAIYFFYGVLILVCIPPANKLAAAFFASLTQAKIMRIAGKHKMVLFLCMAVGAGFAFRAFEVKYLFLGDSAVRPADVENGDARVNGEFLTMYLLSGLYRWLHAGWNFSGLQTIRLVSYISGSLFILVSLLTADAAGKTLKRKTACFVLSALSPAALMQFCGYAETYAFDLLLLQLYLYVSILHLQKKAGIALPAATLVTGIMAHNMLAYMLPSLAFMLYRSLQSRYPLFRRKSTLPVLAATACPFAYHVFKRVALPVMLPLEAGDNGLMAMFSAAHCKEFFNSQLLGGGFMFFVWIAVSLFCIFSKNFQFTAVHLFSGIASLSVTGFLFVVDLWRGSGDWDIYSFGAIVTNPATALLLLDLHERKALKNIRYGVCVMAVFALMHTSFWIITNATGRSAGWVEKAIEKDPASYYKKSFGNESVLGAMFLSNNLTEKALYWQREAYLKHANDPRTGYNYANTLSGEGKTEEAVKLYESSVAKFPAYPLPYVKLVSIYLSNENYDALYRLLLQMETAYRIKPEAFTSRLSQEQIDGCMDLLKQLRAYANN